MFHVLDLFSGIGGFTLGLESTGGFCTVAFCEPDRYCRAVLEKHWPGVAKFRDVRFLDYRKLANFLPIDVICGGFPCQDISVAGKGAGIQGERSGLWSEYARLIGELRPRWAIVENVSALLGRGLGRVLGDLAAVGYDAEWHCIPASAVGAPHRRDRIWIVAYPGRERGAVRRGPGDMVEAARRSEGQGDQRQRDGHAADDSRATMADAIGPRLAQRLREEIERGAVRQEGDAAAAGGWWAVEPAMGRVADGVPDRVDRLRALGNAVVPQIPALIGQAILAAEGITMSSGDRD